MVDVRWLKVEEVEVSPGGVPSGGRVSSPAYRRGSPGGGGHGDRLSYTERSYTAPGRESRADTETEGERERERERERDVAHSSQGQFQSGGHVM